MEDYLGEIKTKPELFLKLVKRVKKPDYIMNIMEDRNGRKAMFYNYKGEEFEEDECVLLKGTIAEHRISTYDGKPMTYINRVTILKNMGSKESGKKVDHGIESGFRDKFNKIKPTKTWQETLAEEDEIS